MFKNNKKLIALICAGAFVLLVLFQLFKIFVIEPIHLGGGWAIGLVTHQYFQCEEGPYLCSDAEIDKLVYGMSFKSENQATKCLAAPYIHYENFRDMVLNLAEPIRRDLSLTQKLSIRIAALSCNGSTDFMGLGEI